MNLALILSAAMLGLASGGHCIAMCGASSAWCMGARAPSASPTERLRQLLPFHGGRIVAYALVGAALGGAAQAFQVLTQWATLLRPLWTMANVALLLFGLVLLMTARQPIALSVLGQRATLIAGKWFRRVRGAPAAQFSQALVFHPAMAASPDLHSVPNSAAKLAPKRGFGVGLAWAFVPCGPLYSAWTLALFAGDPLSGALSTAAFAVASGGQLALAQWWFVQGNRQVGGRWERIGIRVAGAALSLSAGYAIFMLATGAKGNGVFCL